MGPSEGFGVRSGRGGYLIHAIFDARSRGEGEGTKEGRTKVEGAIGSLGAEAGKLVSLVFYRGFARFRDMLLEFTKMNGAGNDFILLDNRDQRIRLQPNQVVKLCDRHRGIGADGVFLLIPCRSGKADWAWEFYNSDGGTAEMCGNGARCFARFGQRLTGIGGQVTFETGAGVIRATFEGDRVTVNLTEPRELRLAQKVSLSAGTETVHSLNTGVPHAVIFVEDTEKAMVGTLGPEIRYHPHFAPKGTNVNFAQWLGSGSIRVRTYERGVEGETLACGTGVTAAALIAARIHRFPSPVAVQVRGGDTLEVSFVEAGDGYKDVRLTGPADFVFEGKVEI
ncbi:MAG: diaminopimelate epimerase [Verrucomicrobiota bacterium]